MFGPDNAAEITIIGRCGKAWGMRPAGHLDRALRTITPAFSLRSTNL